MNDTERTCRNCGYHTCRDLVVKQGTGLDANIEVINGTEWRHTCARWIPQNTKEGLNMTNLETLARNANNANSFREYEEGRATSELQEYITSAEEAAQKAISRLTKANAPEERKEEVNAILERYKVKIVEWLIDYYRNEAACPSMMISGGSNFPTNKKHKQNARRESIMENSPAYLIDKINAMGSNAGTIYSDDENAIDRIKAKIEALEAADKVSKRINAYYKKHGNLDECPDIDEIRKARIMGGRFYGLSYNSTEVRRLKERLLQLDPDGQKADKQITITRPQGRTLPEAIATTYADIIALFDGVKPEKSRYGGEEYYITIPLIFNDGTRKYKELLQFQTEENGNTLHQYGNHENGYKSYFIPLTDTCKFNLIASKISGSGNKAVIYQMLKDLVPKQEAAPEAPAQNSEQFINGEAVTIERNKESMRLQIFFDGVPEVETRAKMKSNGFKWAPSVKAWQRLLNDNAECALKRILDKATA